MTDLAVKIHGTPAPKGSLKCVTPHRVKGCKCKGPTMPPRLIEDSSPHLDAWRPLVAACGHRLRIKAGGPIDGPIYISATLTLPRPKSHYRTGRYAHLLRDDAPAWPYLIGSKDDDKLARCILDGLADPPAHLFGNDTQVCGLEAWKCYPDTPGCPDRLDKPGAIIRVTRLGQP